MMVVEDGTLVVFDVGLAKQLHEDVLIQFIDMSKCMAMGNPEDLVNHLKRFHRYLDGVDWDAIGRDVSAFAEKFRGQDTRTLDYGKLFNEMFAIGRKYKVQPVTDMAMVLVALVTVQGIGKMLNPNDNAFADVARYLIDRGADIKATDWYGRTPLWAAVETRNMDLDNGTFENSIDRAPFLELIQVLLDRGVDPNARTKEVPPVRPDFLRITASLSWVDFTGQTPFIAAALAGDVTVMKLLLKHGADPNVATFAGTTALMAAAGVNWVFDQTYDEGQPALLEAVKLCVELGLDVNAVNSMGLTAMHGAANRGSDEIIKYLASLGAKVDAKDKEGRTPMIWAEGVFLATIPAKPKPSSIALIKQLMAASPARQQ